MIPICDVYLYEDRAQIVRQATISLEEGVNSFVLRDLSPLVVHKSVQVSLSNKQARVNFVDNRVVVVEDDTIDRTRPEEAVATQARFEHHDHLLQLQVCSEVVTHFKTAPGEREVQVAGRVANSHQKKTFRTKSKEK